MRTEMRGTNFLNKLFQVLFYVHLLGIAILAIFLTIRSILSDAHSQCFRARSWYLPVTVSSAFAGILGFAWQALSGSNPSRILRLTFWLSPLLTCAVGVLLVSIGTPGSLGAAAVALLSAVIQSLYSCWACRRFEFACQLLSICAASPPPKTTIIALLSTITCTLYSCLLLSGIGGATAKRTGLDTIFIFLMLLSLAWTSHIIKNTEQVAVSHIKFMQFTSGMEVDTKTAFKDTLKQSMGSICIGSILIPVLSVIQGSARAISMASEDVDEFMFSCTSCYSAIASRLVTYGNRWGFVQVGVYKKGIIQSSRDTWEMFRRAGIEQLINSDLTSSFCFLSGITGGAAAALVGGSWALVVEKCYAIEVTIYTFLIGYFMIRTAMAWPQASVSAYYVAYAENPHNQRFDATIAHYSQELQRSRVQS